MNVDEIRLTVARAAGVSQEELNEREPKTRRGTQIKANALWEGSCSPASERRRVGIFFAEDGEDLAVEGAIKRLSLQAPYPETIVIVSPDKDDWVINVLGYTDSSLAAKAAERFGVPLDAQPRPMHKLDIRPASTLDVAPIAGQLTENPNIILQGPPGTGKTSLALELVRSRVSASDYTVEDSRFGNLLSKAGGDFDLFLDRHSAFDPPPPIIWEAVQLHPGYSYDDLVRRMVPSGEDGSLKFVVEDRLLPQLCRLAEQRGPDLPVLLILDEINRCNLSATLGELIFAIDPGHRGTSVRLQYQGPGLSPLLAVPPNLWIVGTMNTADRSIAIVDYAIRRRFRFLDVPAVGAAVENWYAAHPKHGEVARSLFESCNENLPQSLRVGHSIFLVDALPTETWAGRLARQVAYHVAPLLMEYASEGFRSDATFRWAGIEVPLAQQREIALKVEKTVNEKISPEPVP